MKQCAVTICRNREDQSGSGITFHRFPVREELREAWQISCGLDDNFDFDNGCVCSVHFANDDFELVMKEGLFEKYLRKRLKSKVVPHLNIVKIKTEPIFIDDFEVEKESSTEISTDEINSAQTLDSSSFQQNVEEATAYSPSSEVPLEPVATTPVSKVVRSDASSSSSRIPASLPATVNWKGPHDFIVSFGHQEKNTKGVTWTYSPLKDKLYVGKDVPCPINFSANVTNADSYKIRVMALYGSPAHSSDIVHRCVNHSMDELQKQLVEAEHLVRCESIMASYEIDQSTQRHSVVVPFEIPPVGQPYSTYIYKFACFGSCAGGPNRRPIMLIFSLEQNGIVVGRRRLDVKICACPGRDRRMDEQQLEPIVEKIPIKKKKDSDFVLLSETMEFTKKLMIPQKRSKHSYSGPYIIKAKNKGQYDFLMQMQQFHEMCQTWDTLTPEAVRALAAYHRRKNQDEYSS